MSDGWTCENETALAALRRCHVTWDQLHPRVRLRLERAGCAATSLEARARTAHQRPLQPGERTRGGKRR